VTTNFLGAAFAITTQRYAVPAVTAISTVSDVTGVFVLYARCC